MTINDFEIWLNSFLNFEKLPQKNMFWLDTMEHFACNLGNIHKSCPTIHVAGSKGKGSTSAFISSILTEAGLKTGLYTSPHIITFLERITQNQTLLSQKTYLEAAQKLMAEIESPLAKEYLKSRPVTWFELITLFAFLCFKEAGMDAAVFETGLGGRLDATNVIEPEVCCIGPIELEHTEFLGDTVEKIAFEKGGIIKNNIPAVIAEQSESVKQVFRQIAKEKNSEILFIDEICHIKCSQKYTTSDKTLNNYAMDVEISSDLFSHPLKTSLKLLGDFQAQNAALAAIAVKKAFPEITEEQIERGLSKAFLPGRFEIITNPSDYPSIPLLILDGAHTPRSIKFTLENIEKLEESSKSDSLTFDADIDAHNKNCGLNVINKNNNTGLFSLLFGCAKDKDIKDIVPMFRNRFEKIFVTKPGDVKQSDIKSLVSTFRDEKIDFTAEEDFKYQIINALEYCEKKQSPLLVTGSFYLVSEVKKIISSKL